MSPEEKLIISKPLKRAVMALRESTKPGSKARLDLNKVKETDSPELIRKALNVYKFVGALDWDSDRTVDNDTIAEFNQLQNIRGLSMGNVTPEALATFHMPKLEALRLLGTELDEKGIEALAKMQKLSRLDLDHCTFAGKSLEKLSSLSHLTELTITNHTKGDISKDLAKLDLPELEALKLHEIIIDEKGMEALAKLPNLKVLELDHCKFSAKALEKLPSLSHITLLGLNDHSGGLNEEIMQQVAKLPLLNSLKLGDSEISMEALRELPNIVGLRHLTINWPASFVDVTTLAPLKKLRTLSLTTMPLNPEVLVPLKEMTDLRRLTLDDCDINNSLMKKIGELAQAMPHLKTLSVEGNGITGGMESLLGHPRLFEVHAEDNQIPADTQAKLDEMLKVNLKQEQDAKALEQGKDVAAARQEREARMLRIATIASPKLARIDSQANEQQKSDIKEARAKLITAMVDGANTDEAVKALKEAHVSTAVGLVDRPKKERAVEIDIQAITEAKQEYYSKGAGAVSQR